MTGFVTRMLEVDGEDAAPSTAPRRGVRSLLPVLLAGGVLASYIAYALVQHDPAPPERVGVPLFGHWDGQWYLDIARFAYGAGGSTNPEFRAEFFPLFPALAAGLHAVMPFLSLDAAGVTVNVVLVLAAVALVDSVASSWSLPHRCLLAVFLVTVPNAFFFVCFYGEATLAFCAALVIWGIRTPDKLLWAGAGAALGILTRPVGFLLAVPVVLAALRRPSARSSIASCALVASGLGVLFVVYEVLAGSPIAFVHAQFSNPEWRDWALGRHGWSGAITTVNDAFFGPGFEQFGSQPVGVIVLVVVLTFAVLAWRWDPRLSLGALALVIGPLWFQPLSALARYLAPTWFAWVGGFAVLRRSRLGLAALVVLASLGFACNIHLLDGFTRWVFVG